MPNAEALLRGESLPRRSPSVAWQKVDGEMVLLRIKERELLGLSDVGRRLWEMADGSNSVDRMVSTLVSEYVVSDEKARTDVLSFLEELVSLDALMLRGA